ncbi:MAG: hypothetical protein AAGC55_33945, partial [Myxococcota bacterium]
MNRTRALLSIFSPLVLGLLTVLIIGSLLSPVMADDKGKDENPEEEIDYLALAARLVRDGHFDRAASALAQVDENDEEVDKERLYILRGLVAMNSKLYAEAASSFQKAIEAGARDPVVYISLAQAEFGIKNYRGVISAVNRAGPEARKDSRAELLLSRAHWELDEPGPALKVLARAGKRFPDIIDFPRNEMFYLVKL